MKKQLIAGLILVSLGLLVRRWRWKWEKVAHTTTVLNPWCITRLTWCVLIPLPVLPLISWLRLMKAM